MDRMDRFEKYYVRHITTSQNCDIIKREGKFICSKHIPDMSKNCNQWLGDGVYFWDGNDNDESALNIGKKLVTKKRKNKGCKVAMISFFIKVRKDRHMNLTNQLWEEKFIEFLNDSRVYPNGKDLIDLLEMAKTEKNVQSSKLNKIGMIFGTSINLFLEILIKEYGINIDLVSHSFYHKQKKNLLFGKTELCLKQFCVKNENIIPPMSKQQWEFEYI